MIKSRALLYYVHPTVYNQINDKRLRVPSVFYVRVRTYCPNCHNRIPICTYVSTMIVRIKIQRNFCSILYVRVYYSYQSIVKRNCRNLHNYTQSLLEFPYSFPYLRALNSKHVGGRELPDNWTSEWLYHQKDELF